MNRPCDSFRQQSLTADRAIPAIAAIPSSARAASGETARRFRPARGDRIEKIDDALARLADPLVGELTDGHPERIKSCASDTCDWIFYDSSRTSRRRWCDMATCGNRAKAARHRAREKAEAGAIPDASPDGEAVSA